jgi:hypothetical protein
MPRELRINMFLPTIETEMFFSTILFHSEEAKKKLYPDINQGSIHKSGFSAS